MASQPSPVLADNGQVHRGLVYSVLSGQSSLRLSTFVMALTCQKNYLLRQFGVYGNVAVIHGATSLIVPLVAGVAHLGVVHRIFVVTSEVGPLVTVRGAAPHTRRSWSS